MMDARQFASMDTSLPSSSTKPAWQLPQAPEVENRDPWSRGSHWALYVGSGVPPPTTSIRVDDGPARQPDATDSNSKMKSVSLKGLIDMLQIS